MRPYPSLCGLLCLFWSPLLALCLSGCGTAYQFRYHYTQIAPAGSSEGIEDDRVRIQLSPIPQAGMIQLAIFNKSPRPLGIVWEQTYYLDPTGRRRTASESGLQWFRPSQWFSEETRIAPGDIIRLRVHPGERQYYNPLAVSRTTGSGVTLSGGSPPLLPTVGTSRALGEGYTGQTFQFVLALRSDSTVTPYPFTFRITNVEVK